METVLSALQKGETFLRERGVDAPRLDSELLMGHALLLSRIDLYLNFNRPLCQQELEQLRELFKKRGDRIPLQHILNSQEFRGLNFYVDSRVLIPRPETELLVDAVLALAKDVPKPKILDLCTGSGCMAVSLARERTDAVLVAIDKSWDALCVALINAAKHKVCPAFILGDLFQPLKEAQGTNAYFDFIVSNPPYISYDEFSGLQPEVKDNEPEMALLAGEEGLEFQRKIITQAPDYLKPGGYLILEVAYDQFSRVAEAAGEVRVDGKNFYKKITAEKDYAGYERVAILGSS